MSNKITAIRSDDFFLNVQCSLNDEVLDISGYEFWFTVRHTVPTRYILNDVNAFISVYKDIDDGSSGILAIHINADDMNLEDGDYYYDIQCKNTAGIVKTLVIGEFELISDITRSV